MLEFAYRGRNQRGQREYLFFNGSVSVAIVTAENEDEWKYSCSCGQKNECEHVQKVMEARSEFEIADSKMGDATP